MAVPADPALVEQLERATALAVGGPVRESEPFWQAIAAAVATVPIDELLAVALTFARADAAALRATGAALAAELAPREAAGADDALAVLEPLLAGPAEADVVRIALHGVAQGGSTAGLPHALRLARDPDAGIRLDATHALYSCAGEPPAPTAVEALVALTGDAHTDVRDWAVFGLGSRLAVDTPQVRDALAARLRDPVGDVRDEAALGLARRGDARAYDTVRALLDADEVPSVAVEAAGWLADERLLRPLVELGEWWEEDSDVLGLAIARCDPAARARLTERTGMLVELLEPALAGAVPGGTVASIDAHPSAGELTSELVLHWIGADGREHERTYELEWLFTRPSVDGDPARAAAFVLDRL